MSPSSTPQTTAYQHRMREEFTRQAETMAAATVCTDQEILNRKHTAVAFDVTGHPTISLPGA